MKASEEFLKNYQKVNRYKDELMSPGGFYELPVSDRPAKEIAAKMIGEQNISSVLDIGANDRGFMTYISYPECKYFSLDQDESFEHDYRSLEDVEAERRFGMITMFAVIEHLEKAVFIDDFVPFIEAHLDLNGILVISSNNIFHNVGTRTDFSHVTSYSPRDLHAIMRNFAFRTVKVYRISMLRRRTRMFLDFLSRTLFKPYCLDYAPEICWVFRRSSESDQHQP
jgi:hypothetical protein